MCAMFYGTIPSNKFLSLRIEELVDAIEKCNNSLQTTRYISLKKAKYELELLYRQKEETKEESSFRIKDPFECPFCDSIANKDTFDCHTLRHYPFECAFCYKSFRNESVLHHHYEHYHKFSDNSNDDDFIKNLIRRPIARIISRRHYIRELPKISQYSLFGFDEYENDLEIEFNSNIRPDYQGFRYDTPVSFGTEETPFLPSFTRMFYSSRN